MIILGFDPGPDRTAWASILMAGGAPILKGCGMVVSSRGEALHLARHECAAHVAVERVGGAAFGGNGVIASLFQTAEVAGGIAWVTDSEARTVHLLTAREWRHELFGRAAMTDAQIRECLPLHVDSLPRRMNSHTRDALGVALAVAKRLSTLSQVPPEETRAASEGL